MILGVAIRNEFVMVKLPAPNRHSDCFELIEELGIDINKANIGVRGKDQGFYTTTGKYLDREQAFKYAKRVKQPLIDSPYKALCSENLW